MKRIALILFVALIQISCREKNCCTIIDATVDLSIMNSNGYDLLNPNTPGALNEENIDILILKNGAKVRLYRGNLDVAKFFKIRNSNNKHIFQMYFDVSPESFNGNKITQFIRYKDGTEDEIVGEFNENRKTNTLLQKVWINGVVKTRPFVVVK
ncbi:hypothetical protein [Pedobacter insulae]|uniref:Uncharacterized protein n=1 Tax=Pedobacter insulae TaxID=414048 RepID=A0A1I2XZB5_9SPHI|nr:hypothetical protein [Pedobacter insulae]SFH18814.1 hypothetical protein SAMN04489864_106136 [Pedobacter insulae]